MSEEWSLKGRKIYYVINIEDGRKSHIEENDFNEKQWKKIFSFYSIGDIETLHQKLIEDIKKIFHHYKITGSLKKEIIEAINKRFGDEK